MKTPVHSSFRQQRGAALAVALIMLIMVSLLAAGSFFLTTGEARGAASWSDRQRAMFAAEGVLKEAEDAVKTKIAGSLDVRQTVLNAGTGFYVRHESTVPEASTSTTWTTATAIKAVATETADSRLSGGVYYFAVFEGYGQATGNALLTGTGAINEATKKPRFTLYAKAGGLKEGTYVVLSTSKEFN